MSFIHEINNTKMQTFDVSMNHRNKTPNFNDATCDITMKLKIYMWKNSMIDAKIIVKYAMLDIKHENNVNKQ